MSSRTSSLVSFLKKAIKLEYNDVFLYHKEKQQPHLSEKARGVFEAFGNQEIAHLDFFSQELKKIADEPTIELAPPAGSACTLREILIYHKASEENVIMFYETFLENSDNSEFNKKLSHVISDEKTHLMIIEKLLKEIR